MCCAPEPKIHFHLPRKSCFCRFNGSCQIHRYYASSVNPVCVVNTAHGDRHWLSHYIGPKSQIAVLVVILKTRPPMWSLSSCSLHLSKSWPDLGNCVHRHFLAWGDIATPRSETRPTGAVAGRGGGGSDYTRSSYSKKVGTGASAGVWFRIPSGDWSPHNLGWVRKCLKSLTSTRKCVKSGKKSRNSRILMVL